jgi:hypothetical protein
MLLYTGKKVLDMYTLIYYEYRCDKGIITLLEAFHIKF